jgi:uncharacterized protein YbcC (UPF0753/DUF2309 family)
MTSPDETLTTTCSHLDETLTTKHSLTKQDYYKNYQREKREGVYMQLDKINQRIDTLESLLNDKNSIEIEMNGDTFEWSFTDIKCFLKHIGNISEEKFNKKINFLSAKDKQKYFQMDKSSQILQKL